MKATTNNNLFTEIDTQGSANINGGTPFPGFAPTGFDVVAYLGILGAINDPRFPIPANNLLSPGGVFVTFPEQLLAWELSLT